MEQINLKATVRQEKGKSAMKKLRHGGRLPAVVYHRGESPVEISLEAKEFSRIARSAGGENILINLTIDKDKKGKARPVIVKEIQHDPVRRDILHVDFNEISMNEKLTIDVEIVAIGEPIGVKQDGGMLDHALRMIKIQCLPADIPKHIEVEVSGLALNQSIHVSDLKLSDKIKVLNDPDTLLLQVKKHEEKVEEVTDAVTPEVEVIREKKVEEDEAGKPEAKAKEEPKAEKK